MDITTTAGCDLGDRYSHVCVLDTQGRVFERARIRTTRSGFTKWFSTKKAMTVVIEVGTHSRWVEALLRNQGHQVIVANARQVRLIYAGDRKNDRLDAEKLARLGRTDPTLLRPIKHRGEQAQAQLMMLRSRDELIKVRTSLINHIRGVLKSFGLRVVKCDSAYFARKTRMVIPHQLMPALQPLLDTLDSVGQKLKEYDAQIKQAVNNSPEAQVLTTIAGVGPVTALAFILTIEDPARFSTSRDVGAYCGLVPRRWQTGQSDPQMRISKTGDGFLRRLLVNCAHSILGPHASDSDLRRYGDRLMQRGGRTAKKRAGIAVARKLAALMHRLWTTGEVYEPLRRASARTPAA